MTTLSIWMTLCYSVFAASGSISGQVVDEAGQPVPAAKIFLEPGLAGELMVSAADDKGFFRVDEVPTGPVGVLAKAEGLAFGGKHVNLAAGQKVEAVLVLRCPESVEGRIENARGKPVLGASIPRVAIMAPDKVGIPFVKLSKLGVSLPVSGEKGQFSIPNLPAGGAIALQAVHAEYAQASLSGVAVGGRGIKVELETGVLISGRVAAGENRQSVGQASVFFRNAAPPNDTALAWSGAGGDFMVRLRPGEYLYRAETGTMRSAGWEPAVFASGEQMRTMEILVAPLGHIRGTLGNAATGQPIQGARISLSQRGVQSDVQRTGPHGEFDFETAAGEATVQVEAAAGYFPDTAGGTKLDVKPGETTELPGLWLAPLPVFPVVVADAQDRPVMGAVVSMIQPAQFGWRIADEAGRVSVAVAAWPEDGRLMGTAESPDGAHEAVFMLERRDAAGSRVKLLPVSSVSGIISDDRGKPVAGIPVASVYADEVLREPVALWRCFTDSAGQFHWPAVAAGVPQKCVVRADTGGTISSPPFNNEPGAQMALGPISCGKMKSEASVAGKPFAWSALPKEAGPDAAANKPAVVVCVDAEEAPSAAEGLAVAKPVFERLGHSPVLVVRGGYRSAAEVPVFRGEAPGPARVYVVDAQGLVRLETSALPPVRALAEGG